MKGFKKMLITVGVVLFATVLVLTLSRCSKQAHAISEVNYG